MGSKRKEKAVNLEEGEKKKKHKKIKVKEEVDSSNELDNIDIKEEDLHMPLNASFKEEPTEHTDHETNDHINMNEEDLAELVNRIEQQLPKTDTYSYSTRVEKINWKEVAFKNYSDEDCKKTWLVVQKRVRKFRILKELLEDAKEWLHKPWTNFYSSNKASRHPNMPRKPLSSYMLFYQKKKNKILKENPKMNITEVTKLAAQMYKNLSPEKREKYVKLALEERKKYEEQMKEFYNQHPEVPRAAEKPSKITQTGPKRPLTPFQLFFQSQIKNMASEDVDKAALKEQCRELWKHFPDKKKLVWIESALEQEKTYLEELEKFKEQNPDYAPPPFKTILTKDEKVLKERLLDGKPVKPPNSAYSLFSTRMLQSEEIKSCPLKDRMIYISGLWKNMSEEEKQQYFDRIKEMTEQYKTDFANYIKTLPKEKQQEELKTLSKKTQKTMNEAEGEKTPKKKKKEEIKQKTDETQEVPPKIQLANDEDDIEESLMAKIFALEPEQPPLNALGLFIKNYTGKKSAKEEFNKLSKAEKRKLEKEVQNLKKAYIKDYENFLNGLTKKQLKAFSKWSKKRDEKKSAEPAVNSKSEDNESSSSSSSDSESDSSSSS